ncbi:DUF3857 domain-containing protein [Flavobacterium rhizosphaerae]|uniref:DUF3857 domain-containing protein n=1 Tax=Flavobacterium rhizosphaerae TaxID=3163298 RepID=A0ABW8YV05_9FLAO
MIKNLITALICIVCLSTKAQDFKLGDVSIEELSEKRNPIDTTAAAAILFKRGKTTFTANDYWNVVYEVECRIKIYKKEGYERANQSISYWTGGRSIRAFFSDAATYNLVDGKIEKTKLKGDGEFKEKVNDEFERIKITLPNVKEGSVIEFKYTKIVPYFNPISDWYFQYDIPAKYVEYEFAIPSYFDYNTYLSGYVDVEKVKPVMRYGRGGRFQEGVYIFKATNVKPFKDESYVNNIENYISVLKSELASTNFSSGKEKYATDWIAVAKKIYENDDFGRQLEFDNYFEEDLNALLVNKQASDEEKMQMIFKYVQHLMHWDGESAYRCEKGVKKAYKDKTGNAAEINLMLTAMLRYAGLNANPVLVSTRNNGVALYPTRTAYNYVVAGIKNANGIILLDATSKYTTPGLLPLRALNWQGRMITKEGNTMEVDLMPGSRSREVINVSAVLAADGSINGTVRDQYMDHYAYLFRERHAGENEQAHTKRLEEKYDGIAIQSITVQNDKETDKTLIEQYDFSHNRVADVIGDNIYISPLLFFAQTENPFKQEEREYPVDISFPYYDRYQISIIIPEGYTVESLPKPLSLGMEQNIGAFRYTANHVNNMVQISVISEINYSNISNAYYKTLKDFFQKSIEKQSEKIVLKKA